MRIVSTVPSITELLYDLGLDEQVVGITKFCVHPQKWYKSKERIGGTKNLKTKRIIELNPDWVIANKEENDKEQIQEIQKHCKVLVTDIKTIADNIALIKKLGSLLNTNQKSEKLVKRFEQMQDTFTNRTPRLALYLIWKDPYMTIGQDTFINDVLKVCNFKNVISSLNRYPVLSLEQIIQHKPEYVLLSSEPFPFKSKHIEELRDVLPHSKIILVDGEAFSWYGTRLLKKQEYLKRIAQS